MKSISDIDNEYSTYLGEEMAGINEFSGDFFVEIDHALMKGKIDAQIKNGKFIGVDNIGVLVVVDSDDNVEKFVFNDDIPALNHTIGMVPSLHDHIIEQAYKRFEDENES